MLSVIFVRRQVTIEMNVRLGKEISLTSLNQVLVAFSLICEGPVLIQSLGDNTNFMFLVNDHTIRVWNFSLKTKYETFDTFRHWKFFVENLKGSKVKVFRTDNDMEFYNELFNNYC